MDYSDHTVRIATAIAFVTASLVFWQTFQVYPPTAKTVLRAPIPAGEIVKGFEIRQTIIPPAAERAAPIIGDSCFGLRFATYRRKNSGTFTVAWVQGSRMEQWAVSASSLADNAVRYFCPNQDIHTLAPFVVSISGNDGKTGSAATVWLTQDNSLGHVEGRSDGRALALRITARKRFGARAIAGVCHHVFLASWVSTLLIGLVALTLTESVRKR